MFADDKSMRNMQQLFTEVKNTLSQKRNIPNWKSLKTVHCFRFIALLLLRIAISMCGSVSPCRSRWLHLSSTGGWANDEFCTSLRAFIFLIVLFVPFRKNSLLIRQ